MSSKQIIVVFVCHGRNANWEIAQGVQIVLMCPFAPGMLNHVFVRLCWEGLHNEGLENSFFPAFPDEQESGVCQIKFNFNKELRNLGRQSTSQGQTRWKDKAPPSKSTKVLQQLPLLFFFISSCSVVVSCTSAFQGQVYFMQWILLVRCLKYSLRSMHQLFIRR